jgi:hypothetical protein
MLTVARSLGSFTARSETVLRRQVLPRKRKTPEAEVLLAAVTTGQGLR